MKVVFLPETCIFLIPASTTEAAAVVPKRAKVFFAKETAFYRSNVFFHFFIFIFLI